MAQHRGVSQSRQAVDNTNNVVNINVARGRKVKSGLNRTRNALNNNNGYMVNSLPPAFDLIAATYVVVMWGTISKGSLTPKGAGIDFATVVKITAPTALLAVILGFMDRGALSSPVRAFAGLSFLVAVLYYGADIMRPFNIATTITKKA